MIDGKTITKGNGLKAEDCAVIAQAMSRFKSEAYLIRGNTKINAKSIMGLISLNVKQGDSLYIVCEGVDEEAACKRLSELLD